MQVRAFCLIQWQQFLTTCPEVASGVPYSSCSWYLQLCQQFWECAKDTCAADHAAFWTRPAGKLTYHCQDVFVQKVAWSAAQVSFFWHLPQPLVSAFSTSSHLPKELPGLISGILLFPTIFYPLALFDKVIPSPAELITAEECKDERAKG